MVNKMITDKTQRLGKIKISQGYMKKDPEGVAKTLAMLSFVPVRVESLWCEQVVEMIGLSPLFEAIDCARGPISYEVKISQRTDDEGNVTNSVKVEKYE